MYISDAYRSIALPDRQGPDIFVILHHIIALWKESIS